MHYKTNQSCNVTVATTRMCCMILISSFHRWRRHPFLASPGKRMQMLFGFHLSWRQGIGMDGSGLCIVNSSCTCCPGTNKNGCKHTLNFELQTRPFSPNPTRRNPACNKPLPLKAALSHPSRPSQILPAMGPWHVFFLGLAVEPRWRQLS